MRIQQWFSILILLGLLVLPLGAPQLALAESSTPPATDEVLLSGKPDAVSPQLSGGGSQSYMLGTDPSHGASTTTRQVEVTIPASTSPKNSLNAARAADLARPESTYTITQSLTYVPGPDVLLVIADDDLEAGFFSPIQLLLQAYGDLDSVDLFNAKVATPTLEQLLDYDVVVTWSNYVYFDPVAIGNVMADYVDAGGKVLNAVFAINTDGWQMTGRFMSEDYTAIQGESTSYVTTCMSSVDPSHPIMSGVTNVCDFFSVLNTYLTPNSTAVAQYDNGEILAAVKNDRSVVSINGYFGYYYQWTGNMPDLVHNAILWLASSDSCETILYNNGPFVTNIAGGYNGASASVLQNSTLGLSSFGFLNPSSLNYRLADDFYISNPYGWDVEQLTFYEYMKDTFAFPPISTITAIYYQIWDGPPNDPASEVIFGDLVTNRLVETSWTHTYRVLDTDLLNAERPIMAVTASAGLHLNPGNYWIEWKAVGSGINGPYVPPVTIIGQPWTGDALVYTDAWYSAVDSTTQSQQGMPFVIQGCRPPGETWKQFNSNPVPLMDNVLATYDDKIWSITGYSYETPLVSHYNPESGLWGTVAGSTPPFITAYVRSGCQVGSKVFIYGDTVTGGFTGLWSYNMATNMWTQETPDGIAPPLTGIWAPSWVVDESAGYCYMTGGATAPGGGNLATVYVYNAAANRWEVPMPDFDTPRDFHAAFIFTRPADAHKLLCVAGGVDSVSAVYSSTQCFDFATDTWGAENEDLGTLPLGTWGMGYTQTPSANGLKLWLVNGVGETFGLHGQNWCYNVGTGTWVDTGLLESGIFYRTAAIAVENTVYHIGGSESGFSPSGLSDAYEEVIMFLPLVTR